MNDVPLVKDNNINSINTSIIVIKKQLKQLIEAVGLIDTDIDTSVFVKKSDVVDVVEADNMNPVTSNAVVPVDEVTSGNMHSVTSNAVAQLLQKYEFSGTTDSLGELNISSALPINAVPVCAMSKVGGNVQMIPVTYAVSGTRGCWIQVLNDRTNTVRTNFACQGIVYYLLAPSS